MAFERTLWEERERRWFVSKRLRRDKNGGSETEVTVTSKRHAFNNAQAARAKRYKREEKAASCVVLPVPLNIEDLAERSQRVMSLSGGICCARLSVPINT